jgi:glycerophosphoryl diester phosphodiesterase
MKYIAHRGITKDSLENTIEAFLKAASNPHYDGIECDVYSTLDGEFIVFHDQDLKRLADDDRKIMDLSYDDIKSIKLKNQEGQTFHIPHLVEFLDVCRSALKKPIIEIKKVHDLTLLQNLLVLLEDYMDLNPMLISFDINYLKYIRTLSNIELYFLTLEINGQMIYDCRVNELDFFINKESLSEETIKVLQNKGFNVGVFTVNEKDIEEACITYKVNYLTTDTL